MEYSDKEALLIVLLCRLGERVTISDEEMEDVRKGHYGVQWTRYSRSFQDDTFSVEVTGGP